MGTDLDGLWSYVIKSEGEERIQAVAIYADALEEAGQDNLAWMFRRPDCPLTRTPKELRLENRIRPVMQPVRAAKFSIGTPKIDEYEWSRDKDDRLTALDGDFAVGVFPVTQALYKHVMKHIPDQWQEGADLPVGSVNWWDAAAFCNALSKREKLRPYYRITLTKTERRIDLEKNADGYRLPTETEWAYACRTGQSAKWPWEELRDFSLYLHSVDATGWKNHPVGEIPPNPWGIYEMLANLWEWCDWWGLYLRCAENFAGNHGVFATVNAYSDRSWNKTQKNTKPMYCSRIPASLIRSYIGFRVAKSL